VYLFLYFVIPPVTIAIPTVLINQLFALPTRACWHSWSGAGGRSHLAMGSREAPVGASYGLDAVGFSTACCQLVLFRSLRIVDDTPSARLSSWSTRIWSISRSPPAHGASPLR
jgi:hypothetical protein